jgi:hypothetical protein
MRGIAAVLVFVLMVSFGACDGQRFVLYVAPNRVPCVGVGPMECLLVRYAADGEWEAFYDAIEGFSFDPGYHYTLLVRRSTVAEPVAADASSIRYRLIRILHKSVADSSS